MALPASADRGVLRTGSRAIQLARSAAGKMAGSRRPSPSVSANRARSRDDGEDWRRGLCRAAGVAVVEAADQGQRDDAAVIGWLDGSRLGRVLVEGEVRARGMVVTEITAQTPTEVSLVEDNDVVEYVAADGANHALDEGVLPRRAGRGENLGDADPFHASPELVAVDAIAIAQEVARCPVIGERLDDLLRSPCRRRRIGYVEVHDLAAILQQDHEHVEQTEGRRRHGEEVDGDKVRDVVLQERPPGLRGWLRAPRHATRNGALRHIEAELE